MCGIVGAIAKRNVVPILIEGLKRLEYRGYDSAGVAVLNGTLKRVRSTGRVAELEKLLIGIWRCMRGVWERRSCWPAD